MLPAAEKFVAEMRQACASGLDGRARWERCRELLQELLADPEMKRHAQSWPVGGYDGKKVDNLLFYEDPDYGFVVNALIKPPGGRAMVHDHGPSWTIYGVLEGCERIVRYEATQQADGSVALAETDARFCEPGDVDVVAPREIHSEFAGERKSIAVIVRSQRSGTFDQLSYEGGRPTTMRGPNQVPFELA
jgi:predicted metal-dependent enzyme (double-stranded beta helix superfamily)